MKHLFFIISFICWGCNAQSPTIPIHEGDNSIIGAYYKDTENIFPKFVGTWNYSNGKESFTIELKELLNCYDPLGGNYIDILVGEYKYIDSSGITTINTLPNLTGSSLIPYKNNIAGTVIMDRNLPPDSRRIQLSFIDPERTNIYQSVRIRYISAQGNSPEKIELAWIGDSSYVDDNNPYTTIRVPIKNYTLIKQ